MAVAVGGLIGMERELRTKSAGFRTLILICLGAMLFTVFSQYIGQATSPDRIAANVVVGIGFLGAGVIFKTDNRVNGITTAASIWLTAALGMGIGCGYYAASIIGGLLMFTVLFIFSFMDDLLDRINQMREYKITYTYVDNEQHKYEEVMERFGLRVKSREQVKTGNMIRGKWMVMGSEKKHHAFIEFILKDKEINEFGF